MPKTFVNDTLDTFDVESGVLITSRKVEHYTVSLFLTVRTTLVNKVIDSTHKFLIVVTSAKSAEVINYTTDDYNLYNTLFRDANRIRDLYD